MSLKKNQFFGQRITDLLTKSPLKRIHCVDDRRRKHLWNLPISDANLAPLSHWTPPAITPRRFLTWFFVAPAPDTQVVIDDGEIKDHAWMSIREALGRRDKTEIELAPPTFVTLQWLASYRSVSEATAAANAREPEFFETRIAVSDTGPIALWRGDAGYDNSDATAPGARHRLSMRKAAWSYERDF